VALHVVRTGIDDAPFPGSEPAVDDLGPDDLDRVSPDRPAGGAREPEAARGTPASGTSSVGTITTSSAAALAGRCAETVAGRQRPTPYQSGLAAVARRDVHIERVWPMRSSPTGDLEESSSASFQGDRRGTPPASIVPVGGLRMSQAFEHQPVMTAEVVDLLGPVPPGMIVDATLGGGGHAAALLTARDDITVLGIDRDPEAVSAATRTLEAFGSRAVVRRSRFDLLRQVVGGVHDQSGVPVERRGLSGVLFDLGVSSPQLDVAERGFSYRRDARLDMRMDPTSGRTAADVVNEYDEDALVDLFADNGEGRFARRIARAIVAARPLTTTGELADVVRTAIPAATRRTGGHPSRRVFQAIRIAVNEELDQLATALEQALDLLAPGGRCVVIAYHSGEDRLVKALFTKMATDDCHCPPGLPCVCGADPQFRLVTRGARRPGADELAANPRAEAARLRVIERLPTSISDSSVNGEVA
jgi:16S rRNA (cytosine1402-N4)-methyltransferase